MPAAPISRPLSPRRSHSPPTRGIYDILYNEIDDKIDRYPILSPTPACAKAAIFDRREGAGNGAEAGVDARNIVAGIGVAEFAANASQLAT